MKPANKSVFSFSQRMKQQYNLFQVSDEEDKFIPSDCAANFDKENQWKCIYGQFAMKYLKTPYVMIVDQFDDYHLGTNLGVYERGNLSQEYKDYSLHFGNMARTFLQQYDFAKQGQQGLIYSLACGQHAGTTYKSFFTDKLIDSQKTQFDILAEALDTIDKGKILNKKYIDNCEGVRCNHQCLDYPEALDFNDDLILNDKTKNGTILNEKTKNGTTLNDKTMNVNKTMNSTTMTKLKFSPSNKLLGSKR